MASPVNGVPADVLKEAMTQGFNNGGFQLLTGGNRVLKAINDFFADFRDEALITRANVTVLEGRIAIAAAQTSGEMTLGVLASEIFEQVIGQQFSSPSANVSVRASAAAAPAARPPVWAHAVPGPNPDEPGFWVVMKNEFQNWFNREIKPNIKGQNKQELDNFTDRFFNGPDRCLKETALRNFANQFSRKLEKNHPITMALNKYITDLIQQATPFHLSMGGPSASSAVSAAAAPRAVARPQPSALISGKELRESLTTHFKTAFGQHADSPSSKTVYKTIQEICGDGNVDPTQILNNLSDKLKEFSETQRNNKGTPWLDLDSYKAAKEALAPLLPIPDDENDYKEAPPALPHPDWTPTKIAREWDFCVKTWEDGGRERAHQLNGIVFKQTMAATKNPKFVDLELQRKMLRETSYDPRPQPIPADPTRQPIQTEFHVDNSSTFDVAHKMVLRGLKPLILDMANKHDIGGEPHSASSQEEVAARRSDLYRGLETLAGPGGRTYAKDISVGGIYVPHVQVFRKGPSDGYAIHEPFSCGVYASAAFDCNTAHKRPRKTDGFVGFDKPESEVVYQEQTKEKMRSMFRTAWHQGHDSLVLGAFGCGAYQNKPEEIAQFYIDVLSEGEFSGRFKEVRFAIIELGKSKNEEIFSKAIQDPANVAKLTPASGSSCVIQ